MRIAPDNSKIQILENYKDFTPPAWVPKAVSRLMDGVPTQYLRGLRIISLSNTDGLSHRRGRQKTISGRRIRETQGLYYQKWKGQSARIELFIDKIIQGWPVIFLKIPYFQDFAIADTLYHELGHHIHKTSAPEYKEREGVAEDWRKRLVRLYFQRRYWYLRPLWKLERLMVWLSKLIHPKPSGSNN